MIILYCVRPPSTLPFARENLLRTATLGGLPTFLRVADALRDAPSGRTDVSLNPSLRVRCPVVA